MTNGTRASWCLIVLAFAASFIAYSRLPAELVSHWNAAGVPNGFMSRAAGAFFAPVLMLALFGLSRLLPKIDPQRARYVEFRGAYDALWALVLGFLAYVHGLTLAWNLGMRVALLPAMLPAFAALWYGLGLLLRRARRNWFFGIRTPWTLASDEVWDATQAFAAKWFKASGALALLGLFFPAHAAFFILAPIIASALASVLYSYLRWRRSAPRA